MSRELDFDNLSDDDKAWLRMWNRAGEIPDDDGDADATSPAPDDADDADDPEDSEAEGTSDDDDDDDDDAGDGDGDEPYSDLKVRELREELKGRGLPHDGLRDDLVARLVEDDTEE